MKKHMTPFLFTSFKAKCKKKGAIVNSLEYPYAHNNTKHQRLSLGSQKSI